MKRACLYALLALGLTVWSLPAAYADPAKETSAAPKAEKGKKKTKKKAEKTDEYRLPDEELSAMGKALKKVKYYTDSKPSLTAKYYLLLFSTSTCFHCNRTMPDDVKFYRDMRRQGDVEMMLVTMSQMDNPTAAKGFLDKYGAPFAGAVYEDMQAAGVPGTKGFELPPGFIIVKDDGTVVHHGPGSVNGRNMMQDWKQHTIGEDAEIPPPSAEELKAAAKAEKAAEKAAKDKAKADAKAAKDKAREEKKNKKKK